MRSRKLARSFPALLFMLPIAASWACNKTPTLTFQLDVPGDIASNAAWYEIGAFSGSTCPPSSQFAGGIPSGSAAKLAFAADDASPPGIGNLARGTYAFAGVAKGADCGVIGVGCTVVDVSSADGITISLRANDPPTGACEAGSVCRDAECVSSSDNSDPSVGAGCSLDFLGAGPFADPLAISGTLASTPAISATSNGFLVAYREYDPVAGDARLTLFPIDQSGGTGAPHVESLANRCADEDESDAIGMAFSGDAGLVAIARAPCNGTGGFDFYDVTPDPDVAASGEETSASLATSVLAMSNGHAVAPAPSGNYVTFLEDGQALFNTVVNDGFTATSSSIGGSPPHTGAWVATSDQALAILVGAPSPGSTPPTGDGGTDGGGMLPDQDAGAGSVLRLNLVPSGTNPASLGAPIEFPGTWGSLAAEGSRVFVATSGDQTLPVTWLAFDLGQSAPTTQDGFSVQATGDVSYADVAFHQDNVFFAVESAGAISLVSYAHATTTPTFSREIVFGQNPRIPSLAGLRDGRVVIAASDTRVAVAWVTGRTLGPDDAVGGYAIFACR
ncbi:MAG: hypothetical protein ACRELY_04410 [Polyangiaceae bacterium]